MPAAPFRLKPEATQSISLIELTITGFPLEAS